MSDVPKNKDWSKIEWTYDEEGYSICPDCFESMREEDKNLPHNHASDCEYISYIHKRKG